MNGLTKQRFRRFHFCNHKTTTTASHVQHHHANRRQPSFLFLVLSKAPCLFNHQMTIVPFPTSPSMPTSPQHRGQLAKHAKNNANPHPHHNHHPSIMLSNAMRARAMVLVFMFNKPSMLFDGVYKVSHVEIYCPDCF